LNKKTFFIQYKEKSNLNVLLAVDFFEKFPKYFRKAVEIVSKTWFICISTYWTNYWQFLSLLYNRALHFCW
jgi:hypothetical protein